MVPIVPPRQHQGRDRRSAGGPPRTAGQAHTKGCSQSFRVHRNIEIAKKIGEGMLSQFCGAVTGWMSPTRARISAMPMKCRRRLWAIGGGGEGIGTGILVLLLWFSLGGPRATAQETDAS